MKKTLTSLTLAGSLLVFAVMSFTGCSQEDGNVLTVGATPVPHAELLNLIRDDLAEKGITLRVREFTDFNLPNQALMFGELDANFFQHLPFLHVSAEWYARLTPVFGVHVEPFGIYSARFNSMDELPHGAEIAIPSDPSNGGRALLLLQARGFIGLREDAGFLATPRDIVYNPRGFVFRELEAAQLPRALEDVHAAGINGNFAIQAGLDPVRDSLIIEDGESPYVNFVVVQRGNEDDPRILALQEVLLTQRVRDFIQTRFEGGVVAAF